MTALNIVNVGYHSTNYYILADARPRLLIDAGWPGTWPAFSNECQRKRIQLSDLRYFMVTHFHPDHAGLAAELISAGSQMIVMQSQLAAIPDLRTHLKPDQPYTEPDLHKAVTLDYTNSRAFLAGIGIAGEIVGTPGHSDDSISLVLDQGAAFTGDLTHPMALPDDPDNLARQSWARLKAMGVKMIYPGHGPTYPLS